MGLTERITILAGDLPPQAWEMAKGQMRAVMGVDPADFLTKVHCPVLAIFGEADTSNPVEKSAALYKQYLSEAGNEGLFFSESRMLRCHSLYITRDRYAG